MIYDFHKIEKKWRERWLEKPPYRAEGSGSGKKKYYCLSMFPYPSGSGLHMGHCRNYVISDVQARHRWLKNYDVLHPMGWDAFGLPAENYAIKMGIHPRESTERNVKHFREQLDLLGTTLDWSREVNTSDPSYYKWTQWIFLQMYKAGLAYEEMVPVNWCPSCKTVLANEEVVGGKCERCGTPVEKKKLRQWILRITKYADRLLEGLKDLDWPEKVKLMQKNWIGKSRGLVIRFPLEGIEIDGKTNLEVFTTRPDTLFGVTFLAVAADADWARALLTPERRVNGEKFIKKVSDLADVERQSGEKSKDGFFSGSYARHPLTGEKIPVYLTSYVLASYGTGAVMGVPAHDQRDFEFAGVHNLPVKVVIRPDGISEEELDPKRMTKAIEEKGKLINSDGFDGLDFDGAFEALKKRLEELGLGEEKVMYRLRDWVFSRQRYWGEPIPLVHCPRCGVVPVPEEELPVKLPDVKSYKPTGTGESPLAAVTDWVNTTCPKCGGPAKRETNTMPQWAGSCWYFLRYCSPNYDEGPFDPKEVKYWMPVDLYIGGVEHAILHLLYARFYVKVLHDLGYIDFDEPFTRLFNQGMILKRSEKTGRVEKMSKSKGNVVTPEEIIDKFGVDALRTYILFMGPPEDDVEWQSDSIKGVRHFLDRVWITFSEPRRIREKVNEKSLRAYNRYVKEFTERLLKFKLNTIVSLSMEFFNSVHSEDLAFTKEMAEGILAMISVFAPHLASEILEIMSGKRIEELRWPEWDERLAKLQEVEIAVQVNGKTRGAVKVEASLPRDYVEERAREVVAKWLEGKDVVKTIFVPGRIVNFVVK